MTEWDDAERRVEKAQELFEQRRWSEALEELRAATDINPYIGGSLADRGLFDKAIYCWQKTLDLDETHPDVQVRIAEALWGKGELEGARQHYLIGLRQDPGNTEILLDLGDLLVEMGRGEEA